MQYKCGKSIFAELKEVIEKITGFLFTIIFLILYRAKSEILSEK